MQSELHVRLWTISNLTNAHFIQAVSHALCAFRLFIGRASLKFTTQPPGMMQLMLILMMISSTKSWVSISNIEKSPQLIFKMRELWSLSNNGQLTQLKFTTDQILCLVSVVMPLSRYQVFKQVPDNLVCGVWLYFSFLAATGCLCD